MRPGYKGALALLVVLATALVGASGCADNSPGKEADEGVPIQLGDLKFNVSETRFLNPSQPDDKDYLAGQKVPPPAGKAYLGVFLTVHNEGDHQLPLPSISQMTIVDTTGVAYEAIPSSTPFSAPLGTPIAGGGDIPAPDTPAANGPTQGALVTFLVDNAVNENRPLKLEISSEGETGEITLDI
jgi:hypothetical protein